MYQPRVNCGHGLSATRRKGDNPNGNNCRHSGDRLSQNVEKQQVKMATARVYTITALTIWSRNYYVAHVFVVCNAYSNVCDVFEIYDNRGLLFDSG